MILSVENNDKLQRRQKLPLSRDQGLAPFLRLYLSKIMHLLPSVIWPPSLTLHSHLSNFKMKEKKKKEKIGFIIETKERPCNPNASLTMVLRTSRIAGTLPKVMFWCGSLSQSRFRPAMSRRCWSWTVDEREVIKCRKRCKVPKAHIKTFWRIFVAINDYDNLKSIHVLSIQQ